MTIREVQQYGLRHLVSPELAADRTALEAFMRADIDERVEAEGYVVLPDTYNLQLIPRNVMYGEPILTEEERAAGMTGDEKIAMMTVNCYRP